MDYLTVSEVSWSGRLSEPDFLARLYDLNELPSFDPRLKTARSDIRQHRINFLDWEHDWVFTDSRFAILWTSDEKFLRFFCESLHPIVRPDPSDAGAIATKLNEYLVRDGWELFEESEISGRPVFGARPIGHRALIFDEPTGWEKVDRQIQEVRLSLLEATTEEHFQTVGLLCREAMISLAQAVYDPSVHPSVDGIQPSPTDATRMLQAYFAKQLSGSANEESRAHTKAAIKLAAALQHKRTADYQAAALCAEACASIVNIASILSGRRM